MDSTCSYDSVVLLPFSESAQARDGPQSEMRSDAGLSSLQVHNMGNSRNIEEEPSPGEKKEYDEISGPNEIDELSPTNHQQQFEPDSDGGVSGFLSEDEIVTRVERTRTEDVLHFLGGFTRLASNAQETHNSSPNSRVITKTSESI